MATEPCKIKAYIGFAIKSRGIKYGVDDILKLKSEALILVSDLLAKSSYEKLTNFAQKNKCEVINFESNDLSELFDGNTSIKAVAITDKNLAVAIKKNMTK